MAGDAARVRAEPADVADLARAVKPIDAWWTVLVVDPVAVRVLPGLVRLGWVTPNLVTGLAFLIGCGAVAAFASGHLLLGGILYELRFFLDCLDGKIARVRRLSSPLGAVFDRTADALTIPAAYASVGFVLARRADIDPVLALAPALMSVLVAMLDLSLELVRRSGAAAQPGPTGSREPARAVVAWFRRHRLTLVPWTVDAEAVGLFLAPVLLRGSGLAAAELGVAALYVLFAVVDLAFMAREAGYAGSQASPAKRSR